MIHKKIIKISARKQFKYYDKFANIHWGEHSQDGDTNNDFFATPNFVVCIFDKQFKVSLLFIFLREISINNQNVKIAGIGGVVTHTSYRHKGFASKLLVDTIEFLKLKHLASFCILCTDIDRLGKLYNNAGFLPLIKPYYFIDKNGVEKEETGGMVFQIDPKFNMEMVLDKNVRLNIGFSNV